MRRFLGIFREITRYPSAVIGLIVILLLVALAVYAVIALPQEEAVRLWKGGPGVWDENPTLAPPAWFSWFSGKKMPETIALSTTRGQGSKEVQTLGQTSKLITLTYSFDYPYDDFPKELSIYFKHQFEEKKPFATIDWITPDGRKMRLARIELTKGLVYRLEQDDKLLAQLPKFAPQGMVLTEGQMLPQVVLFLAPGQPQPTPLKGTYTVLIRGTTFETAADIDATLVVYGQVHGLAGTDYYRRDLVVPLLWGAPIALSFGLLAALGTTVTTMAIAAIGTWFGGLVDGLIQRITEVNMVLPLLPILIMVSTLYKPSIWLVLGLVILLSIFGAAIKNYRAIFLQVKEAPYIEAARSYGAGNWRIVFRYLIPRIIPMTIPQIVTLVPTYVFLEASLAFLGVGDPNLPTWGKVINEANSAGALTNGWYYWVLEPAALLMITGLGFALVGYALDRIFNPRLRGM